MPHMAARKYRRPHTEYSPEGLFILPPEYKLPEVARVVGWDVNYQLRQFLEHAMPGGSDEISFADFDKALDGP